MTIIRLLLGVLIGGVIGTVLGYFSICLSRTCPCRTNPFRGALYGAIVGGLLVLASSILSQEEAMPSGDELVLSKESTGTLENSEDTNVIHVENMSDFKAEVLHASEICLVDLYSDRCPPCRMLTPTISSLADKYAGKVTVCKINVDHAPTIANEYNVMVIPTVFIIKNGEIVKRLVGLRPEREYAGELDELIH